MVVMVIVVGKDMGKDMGWNDAELCGNGAPTAHRSFFNNLSPG
jgi:hypothetical protein